MPVAAPYLIYEPFGASAANPTYINLPIPVPSQIGITVNAASFTDGFPPSTMTPEASGGLPFFGQDMNGILYMISAYCANFAAGAFSPYNATLSAAVSGYTAGAVLLNENGNGLWINVAGSGNTTNPDTGGSGWQCLASVGAITIALSNLNVTLLADQWVYPFIRFSGALSANVNVIFPASEGQQWILDNNTTGAYTVTAKTSGGTGVIVPATGAAAPTSIYCDGVNIQNTGISTAGLAPINSPTFTGVPNGPTASPATTSTTQLATTAFTQNAIAAALTTYAPLASPIFTGTPSVPTASPSTNNTQAASTAFVKTAVGNLGDVVTNGTSAHPLTMYYGSCTNAGETFPTPFPTACVTVSITPTGSSGAGAIASFDRFGFAITGGGGNAFLWQAWGY